MISVVAPASPIPSHPHDFPNEARILRASFAIYHKRSDHGTQTIGKLAIFKRAESLKRGIGMRCRDFSDEINQPPSRPALVAARVRI